MLTRPENVCYVDVVVVVVYIHAEHVSDNEPSARTTKRNEKNTHVRLDPIRLPLQLPMNLTSPPLRVTRCLSFEHGGSMKVEENREQGKKE